MKTTSEYNVPVAPPQLCRYLRTKRMYIPALADNPQEQENDHGDQGCYWCNLTQSALGQDDGIAHPSVCLPGRTCHEA